jgi:HEAT repeats
MPGSIDSLKVLVLSDDDDLARAAFEQLDKLGGPAVLDFYSQLLQHPDPWRRNSAALGLKQLGDARVVPALLQAIFKPEHRGSNGTIVYALVSFDCADLLEEIMLIIFYQGFEAACTANLALDQEFNVTLAQKISIQRHWQLVKANPPEAVVYLGVEYLEEVLDELFEDVG